MLILDQLNAYYGASQALFGMSLQIQQGEVVTLLGRNGMGKTTTVNSIMGIVSKRFGKIEFAQCDISTLPAYKIAQMGLGLVPEGRQIFPNLTVRENLIATAANRGKHNNPWTLQKILALFPSLATRQASMGRLLSGGEQQMLAIGRALMTNPKLLILDEASEGLAPLIRQEIWACLQQLKHYGQSILLIDKNLQELKPIADRHYVIEKGKVVWHGSNAELDVNPQLLQRYLGV